MANKKEVRTTLSEDFEALGLPMDMGDSARMVGISAVEEVASEKNAPKKSVQDEEGDGEDDDSDEDGAVGSRGGPRDGTGPNPKCSKKEDVVGEESDPLEGEYVTKELLDRIRSLPFENLSEDDLDELMFHLGEKKLPDGDAQMQEDAVEVVGIIKEGMAASRIRRFKHGSVARKMSFQCPQGRRADPDHTGPGKPRCVPSFRAAGSVGKLNKEGRRKRRWGRAGSGVMSKMKSARVDKRRSGVRGEGLLSPLAQELMAVSEGVADVREAGVREEIIERIVTILEFLNEEFSDKSVSEIYTEAIDTIIDTYEAGRLDEEVLNEDEFIAELDRALTLVTKSLAKLDDGLEAGND